jgi:hypothetical protein
MTATAKTKGIKGPLGTAAAPRSKAGGPLSFKGTYISNTEEVLQNFQEQKRMLDFWL